VQCQVAGGDVDQVESLASARAKGIETTFERQSFGVCDSCWFEDRCRSRLEYGDV